MSKDTIVDFARNAAQAEQRIVDLLDKLSREDLADTRSEVDLPKSARPRQGETLRGG